MYVLCVRIPQICLDKNSHKDLQATVKHTPPIFFPQWPQEKNRCVPLVSRELRPQSGSAGSLEWRVLRGWWDGVGASTALVGQPDVTYTTFCTCHTYILLSENQILVKCPQPTLHQGCSIQSLGSAEMKGSTSSSEQQWLRRHRWLRQRIMLPRAHPQPAGTCCVSP